MNEISATPIQPTALPVQSYVETVPTETNQNTNLQPNIPTSAFTPTELPKPKNKKPLLVILLILILGIIAGGGYLYLQNQKPEIQTSTPTSTTTQPSPSPTTGPTAGWETYVDSSGKFSFSYPLEVQIEETTVGSVQRILKASFSNGPKGSQIIDGYTFSISSVGATEANQFSQENTKRDAEKTRANTLASMEGSSCEISPVKQSWLGPYVSYEYTESNCVGNSSVIYVSDVGITISMTYEGDNNKKQIYKNTLDQILSTFEFIENIPTPVITKLNDDWNSYKTEAMNILFEYPATYETIEERIDYLAIYSPPIPNRPPKVTSVVDGELKIEIYVSDAKIPDSSEQCWYDHNSATSVLDQEITTVGGVKGILYTWEGVGTGQSICLIKDNKRYSIVKYPANTSRQDEYEHFLSTFRFYSEL